MCYDVTIMRELGGYLFMGTVIIISIIIFVIVLALTIFTINKGYAYKHTIDEHPDKMDKKQKTQPPE